MFRHNLLITYRSFMRNKSSFVINLIGLSTGLACVLLIYLWVSDEIRMDKFHEKDEQLYLVMNDFDISHEILHLEKTPFPLGQALLDEMPEVEQVVTVNDFSTFKNKEGILSHEEQAIQAKGWHASKNFFDVFSFKLLEGNKDQVLVQKNDIVLSDKLALKLFNTTENLIGKTLQWEHTAFTEVFQISGVFESPGSNSTAQFDFVIGLEIFIEQAPFSNTTTWLGNGAKTFVVLKKGTDLLAFNKKIAGLMKTKSEFLTSFTLYLQKYSSRYLYAETVNGIPVGGRITYLRLFSLVALFILLIACVNFMNLSTARASIKMKEIGVKKTIGATRKSLAIQFLTESILTSILSVQFAFFWVALLLPKFNEITGKELEISLEPKDILAIAGIVLFTGLFSGSYPALYLSGFKPISVLKGKLNASLESLWIRKGLVVFQFALSVMFIVAFLIVNEQIKYTQTKKMGYSRDNVISFQWKGELYDQWTGLLEGKSNQKFEAFMMRLKEVPGVVSSTNMSGNILNEVYGQSAVTWEGQESEGSSHFQSPIVGYDFLETLDIKLLAGRTFSRDFRDDYSKIMVNQAAVKLMKLENPIGEVIGLNEGSEIVGVIDDFHYGSLYNTVEPMILRFDPNGRNILVKIQAGAEKPTLERLKTLHDSFLPNYFFEFSFMDEDYQALYEAESRVAALSNYLAVIAIIISCLGLFGLAAFTAERRAKEIGIRKILGSSVFNIVALLSRDFTKMVLVAILSALPVSYYIAMRWLEGFAFKIELQWWYFIGAGLAAFLIAWLTVGLQTFKAASTRPVHVLRDE